MTLKGIVRKKTRNFYGRTFVTFGLLLLRTMLNRWCGSPVAAIKKQRIGKRQGTLFCRK